MSQADQQPMSHADSHDLDKLARWKAGLDAAGKSGSSSFPACAIFLVTGEDRASHDIFRRYRSAFEELGGGFHHLVIFGQHGVSKTQQAFLAEVGLDQGSVPLLAVVPMSEDSTTVYCVELQKGDPVGDLDESQSWAAALGAVGASAAGLSSLSLIDVEGVRSSGFRRGSLTDTVGRILTVLSEKT